MDESSLGQSKAKCVCAFLQELNDAVKAKFVEEYPEALIEGNPSFFSSFTLVIATQVCRIVASIVFMLNLFIFIYIYFFILFSSQALLILFSYLKSFLFCTLAILTPPFGILLVSIS